MEDKLLTIVVPTYNIEQYIHMCINSFKEVNSRYFSDFEVLVVNDGSTDNSVQVVEELIKDSELDLRIITKENGGHGSTINRGIKEAKGKYFKVIDGDDWVNVPDFEKLLDNLKEVDVDMVITDYTEQHLYNNTTVFKGFSNRFIPNTIIYGIPDKWTAMHAIIYKTHILREYNIMLSENTFYVDQEYTMLPLKYVKNYYYMKLDIYQYFLGRPEQSMNIEIMKKRWEHHERVTKNILKLYKEIYTRNNVLEKVISDALQYLINRQLLLYIVNGYEERMYELLDYVENCKYKYKLEKTNKITYLVYINYRAKYIFNPLVKKIIRNKRLRSR